jgi:D-ribose pyranose/furanose isomerase RbsD
VLVQATAELTQSNQQQNQKIDLLTDQIGHLTEVVTTGFAELKELTQQQSDTAKRQEQNITRLVGIVETLIQQHT